MCGKQSAGKSSVLEAITGLEFPKGDGGPCTRFVIEYIVSILLSLENGGDSKQGPTLSRCERGLH